jgi:hypothetical protein
MIVARSPGFVASASARNAFGSAARRRSPSAISDAQARTRASRAAGGGSMTTIVVSFGSEAATASTFSICAGVETTHTCASEFSRMYWHCGAVSVG